MGDLVIRNSMMVVDRPDSLRFGPKSDLKWRLILVMWLLVYGGLTVADGWIYGRRLLGIMVVVEQIDRKRRWFGGGACGKHSWVVVSCGGCGRRSRAEVGRCFG